jgi:hypothetical protein
MKIVHEFRDAESRATRTATASTLQTAFTAALRSHQHSPRVARHVQPTSAKQDARTHEDRAKTTPPRATVDIPVFSLLESASTLSLPPALPPPGCVNITAEAGEFATPGGFVMRPARRTPQSFASEGNACFEVTDTRSGLQFLLSQHDGAWLLTLQSNAAGCSTSPAELVSALRLLFAERGLGSIDVIG